jgi:DNA-binding NarL/FixJ family response regulator
MTARPLRLLIGCDAPTRDTLRRALASQNHTICAEVGEFAAIHDAVKEHHPDVLIIDLGSAQPGASEAIRQSRDAQRDIETLGLVAYEFERTVREAWNAGAKGFILKPHVEQLEPALNALALHKPYAEPELAAQVLPGVLSSSQYATMGGRTPHLTPREREIVQLVAEGRTSKEIALALSLSPKTIEAHRASILKKLNRRSASQMVLHAVRNNIIQA